MNKIIEPTKRVMAFLIVFLITLSSFLPITTISVNAQDSDLEIKNFAARFVSGAGLEEGKYVWNANNTSEGHRFTYRISFTLSGTGEIDEGKFVIRIPKNILKDRNGNYADVAELSIPSVDEADGESEYYYYIDGDEIVIVNQRPISSAQSGFIELAYDTSEKTFEYVDMAPSDPFVANISVTKDNIEVTAADEVAPVHINTGAEIEAVSKSSEGDRESSWKDSWGEKPEDADEYYYLIWRIVSNVKDVTQPYNFTLADTFSNEEAEIVGYKLSGESVFSDKHTVYNCCEEQKRIDYVLTRHKKSFYEPLETYTLKNKVEAQVDPVDQLDEDTSAQSSAIFVYTHPEFQRPIGRFNSSKKGSGVYNYGLDDLKERSVPYTEKNLNYIVRITGYSYPWTRDNNADPDLEDSYGKKKVKFVLTDEDLYFNGNPEKLTSEDYEIGSISYFIQSKDAEYDTDNMNFVMANSVTYADDEYLTFYAKFNDSEEFVYVGRYHIKTQTPSFEPQYVKSMSESSLVFNDNCTGFQIVTENVHYYTNLSAAVNCRLKPSDYILEKTGSSDKVYLRNKLNASVLDADDEYIYHSDSYANDYSVGVQKKSEIIKEIKNTVNNKAKKFVTIGWKVRMSEYFTSNEGTEYVNQSSGRFYDLLPIGCEFVPDSVRITADYHVLPSTAYDIQTIPNYNGTGRTMIIADIRESGDRYYLEYSTTYSWDNMADYGKKVLNSVAYQTGNDSIAGGFPDNGGNIEEKLLMQGLDDESTGNRFIYGQRKSVLDVLSSASVGLTKRVKGPADTTYKTTAKVGPDAIYSYRIRFSTDAISKSKNLIFYDSLENYNNAGDPGNWKGRLVDVDVSQLIRAGISPVVYYSKAEGLNINIDDNRDLNAVVGGEKLWLTAEEIGDLSLARAVAIDLRKDSNGNDFVLGQSQSLTTVLYLRAPENDETQSADPVAYNNIYAENTVIDLLDNEEDSFVHYNFTTVHYRVMSDFGILKVDSSDTEKPVKDISFCLDGTSDYGTGVYKVLTTDKNGQLMFRNIEKGTYRLFEYAGTDDYQEIREEMVLVIDGYGHVTLNGEPVQGYATITNDPRVHTDIQFTKRDLVNKRQTLPGIKFKLYGTSDYGTDVILYSVSDSAGVVTFENIEPGKYKMTEIETDEAHVLSDTIYTVTVDDNGNFSVSDSYMETNGTISVYNEPYHSFTVLKVGYSDGASVAGAKFRLYGTSDYGTKVDMEKVSFRNGQIIFSGLEAGTYILEETEAPEDYTLDETKRIVKITADGSVTISGIDTNAMGYHVIPNKENGVVTITKKWIDRADNDTRPTPIIHLSSERKATEATFIIRPFGVHQNWTLLRYYFNNRAFDTVNKAKGFRHWTETDSYPEGAYRVDDQKTDYQIYVWMDEDGIIWWWSDAQEVYLPENCTDFFRYLPNLEVVDLKDISTAKTNNMSNMFYGCSKMTELDISSFDTSNVTNMSNMFYNCRALTELDLSSLDTSNVTDMGGMFSYCSGLTELDLSPLDTSNVTSMGHMFFNCSALTELDLSPLDTSKVTNMAGMFKNCTQLTDLELRYLDTSKVTNMANMFENCSKLTDLDLRYFDTSSATDMGYMFSGCELLTDLDLRYFDTSNVRNMGRMFSSCKELSTIDISYFDTAKVTDMSGMFSNCFKLTELDVNHFDTSNVTNMADMFYGCRSLTELDLSRFDTSNVTNMAYMFGNCRNLIELDLSRFDTSKVTSMIYMFYGCNSLTELDVSRFDTSNVTNMANMFHGCRSLTELDVSRFDTSKVTVMSEMFQGCSSLTELDLSHFDTSNVMYMTSMFSDCRSLTELDVRYFDTSKVKNMSSMFFNCYALTELDVSRFDTSNVTNMASMFSNCHSLTELDVSRFDTSKVTNMSSMFNNCNALTELDVSRFNTSKVTMMDRMFATLGTVSGFDYLDLSSFDTSKVTDFTFIFYGTGIKAIDLSSFSIESIRSSAFNSLFSLSAGLTTIYASDKWDGSKVESMTNSVFDSCTSLVGGNGTTYSTSSVKYARIDDPANGKPGYFTYKAYVAPEPSPLPALPALEQVPAPEPLPELDPPDSLPALEPLPEPGPLPELDPLPEPDPNPDPNPDPDPDPDPEPEPDTIHYVSTDTEHCEIVKNDDGTWTYTFTGLNPRLQYYTWEEEPAGYTASNTEYTAGVVSEGHYTITNTSKDNPPTFGSIGIVKLLTGDDLTVEDREKAFEFSIILTDENDQPVSGAMLYGGILFTDGSGQLSIKPGEEEKLVLSDIPTGWHYHISENSVSGFELTESVNTQGVIGVDTEIAVRFTNTKTTVVEAPKTSFILKKLLSGNFESYTEIFGFNVTLSGLEPGEEYVLSDGTVYKADRFGNADVRVTLHNGEMVEFVAIPVGATYRITEDQGPYTASYTVRDANLLGLINTDRGTNTQENKPLSTAVEEADEGEAVTVTFTNRVFMYQDLKLKKLVANASDSNTDEFTFTVELSELNSFALVNSSVGVLKADSDGKLEVTFTVRAGEIVTFEALPVGTKYRIIEAASSYIASYLIQDANGVNNNVSASGYNLVKDQQLATETETVNQGEDVTVVFTNRKDQHDLKISKFVDFTYGDEQSVDYKAEEFKFRLELIGLEVGKKYTLSYGADDMTGTEDEYFYAETDGTKVLTITLKDGNYVTVRDLPEGAQYRITELANEHYIPSYQVAHNEGATVIKAFDSSTTDNTPLSTSLETVDANDIDVDYVFTNRYIFTPYMLPDSGMENAIPVLVMAAAGMVFFGALFILSRKKRS